MDVSGEGKTILIVDDNEDLRTIYGMVLAHFGYRVLQAGNGSEGVRRAREQHPHLILMDITMPVVDGLEATELLKVDVETAPIPVIAVTAHDDSQTRARALEAGCETLLPKPLDARRMLHEVERALHRLHTA